MTQVSQPGVTVAIAGAITQVANQEQKVLFIGQKTTAGTALSGELITDIQNDNSWDTLFGENSMLAEMIRNAREQNIVTSFAAIGLDDNGTGVKATITITSIKIISPGLVIIQKTYTRETSSKFCAPNPRRFI